MSASPPRRHLICGVRCGEMGQFARRTCSRRSLAPLPNPNAAGRNAPTGANERREEGGKGEWKVKLVGKNNTHHSKRGNRPRRSLPRKHFSSSLSLLFSFRPDISHSSQRANHTWTFIAPKRTSERTLSQPNKRTERIANPNMDDPPDVRGPTALSPVFFSGRSTPSSLSCLPRSPAFWQCC